MKLFSLDHLLLAGRITDRGQLSARHRRELNKRAAQGKVVKIGTNCWVAVR